MDYYQNAVEFQLSGSPKFLVEITRGVLRYNPALYERVMRCVEELAQPKDELTVFRKELCTF